jgi:3-carboxy-cis,cis-muconate cycloisomerase
VSEGGGGGAQAGRGTVGGVSEALSADGGGPGSLFDGVFARGNVAGGWLRAMLDAEAALARAVERAALAPAGAGQAVTDAVAAGSFDGAWLGAQAALTGNPVPALVRELTRMVPPEAAVAVHRGATSQDIIDTAAMLLARRALGRIATDLAMAADGAVTLAEAQRDTVMIGRTLLQQAVPVTFGLVAAGWLSSLDSAGESVGRVSEERLAIQYGGAAGTLASLGPEGPGVARLFAEELGLGVPVLPWHTDRLRIVEIAAACAGAAGVLGKIARDVTLLAQPELGEVREGEPGQPISGIREGGRAGAGVPGGEGEGLRRGGSSAMPHKRNPVAAVAILGCTRRVPGLVATLVAAAEQEHQRAAGAWHAEWEPFADLLRLTGSASSWGAELLTNLVVDPERMRTNLDATHGLPVAENVTRLLAPALGPVEAHDLVATASAHAIDTGIDLREALLGPGGVRHRLDEAGISPDQIDSALDPRAYLGATQHFINAALAFHRSHPR